jgi:TPR repeat protein
MPNDWPCIAREGVGGAIDLYESSEAHTLGCEANIVADCTWSWQLGFEGYGPAEEEGDYDLLFRRHFHLRNNFQNKEACYLFGRNMRRAPAEFHGEDDEVLKTAFTFLSFACDGWIVYEACLERALMIQNGEGMLADPERATEILTGLCDSRLMEACEVLSETGP